MPVQLARARGTAVPRRPVLPLRLDHTSHLLPQAPSFEGPAGFVRHFARGNRDCPADIASWAEMPLWVAWAVIPVATHDVSSGSARLLFGSCTVCASTLCSSRTSNTPSYRHPLSSSDMALSPCTSGQHEVDTISPPGYNPRPESGVSPFDLPLIERSRKVRSQSAPRQCLCEPRSYRPIHSQLCRSTHSLPVPARLAPVPRHRQRDYLPLRSPVRGLRG